ncbi:MAG: hypothetical protein PVSMB7_02300 [Chloroflexota bacterium]
MSHRVRIVFVIFFSSLMLFGSNVWHAWADSPAAPDAPTSLLVTAAGSDKTVPAAAWVASTKLQFHFKVHVVIGSLTPQVEVVPADSAFTGKPNYSAPKVSATGVVTVTASNLVNGFSYRWQARVVDDAGTESPWTIFNTGAGGTPDFSIDTAAPTRPVVTSTSNPSQSSWSNNRTVTFAWKATDPLSGIKGYTFVLEQRAHVIPPGSLTSQTHLSLDSLSDGSWILAVRAMNRAGSWSPTATYRVLLDRQAPRLNWLAPHRFRFNPYRGPTTVRFSVSKDAHVQLQLFRVGSARPVKTYSFRRLSGSSTTSVVWNGKDEHNNAVPKGFYFFAAQAVDHANNVTHVNLGGIDVNPERPTKAITGQPLYPGEGKRIIVSVSRETLYAYDGNRLLLQTYVTTGNPNLPTPLGSFTITAKYHPYEFVSPWPEGSPYYYSPSLSNYAMLFHEGGYFLHDAPWRSAFGPGTNRPGQPGTNYGGTHGCINIPPAPTLFLWNWAPIGTPVLVVN